MEPSFDRSRDAIWEEARRLRIPVITPVPSEMHWTWVLNGRTDSMRTQTYTASWDLAGIQWVADRPQQVPQVMRQSRLYGYYVPERDLRAARSFRRPARTGKEKVWGKKPWEKL